MRERVRKATNPASPTRQPETSRAARPGPERPGEELLRLQRVRGNRYVQRLVESGAVGRPGDRFERAADRVADRLALGAGPPARPTAGPALASPPGPAGTVAKPVARGIDAARGGAAIPEAVRAPVERALGADLGDVRVHTDRSADRLSRGLGALAFTTGRDVFFRSGLYRPETADGRRVLAHELTHVVQQAEGAPAVQCLIVAEPHPGDLDEVARVDNKPAGYPHYNQGVASQPVNYRAPTYRIDVVEGWQGFVARLRADGRADVGNSDATYLAAGEHLSAFYYSYDTDYEDLPTAYRMISPTSHRTETERVVLLVSDDTARGSKAAEQEHLEDYRYAFGLTLQAAEDAIAALEGRGFPGKTPAFARRAAEQSLLGELDHRSNGNLGTVNPQDWEQTYQTLFRRSGNRDLHNWHKQALDEAQGPRKKYPWSKKPQAYGMPVHYLRVVRSAEWNVGTVGAAQQVDPHHGG